MLYCSIFGINISFYQTGGKRGIDQAENTDNVFVKITRNCQ